ncbi:hypothetical protein PENTCL1PPCAC_12197, partial [Pristionchus entomophagus]
SFMESAVESNVPVFELCGVKMPLIGVKLPDSHSITHTIPEGYEDFIMQRQDRTMCDVTIIVGETTIYAHRGLLSARIPYFRGLFNSNMIECQKGEISLSNEFCGVRSVLSMDWSESGEKTAC